MARVGGPIMARWLWRWSVVCVYVGGGSHQRNGGDVVGPRGGRLRVPCSKQLYSTGSESLLLIVEDREPQF